MSDLMQGIWGTTSGRHARAYMQGANSRSSTIVMSMNLEFAAYLSTWLEGMKTSTQRKAVKRAFAIVGKKLIKEGQQNLRERQHTHNTEPNHVPLIKTFQYKVVGGKKCRTADMKLYVGFDTHGHHSIWADRGIWNRRYEYRVRGNYFWTDVRQSTQQIAAPLIIKGLEQALIGNEGDMLRNLRFDGRRYTREQLHVDKELL